jgi:hypothetical protein
MQKRRELDNRELYLAFAGEADIDFEKKIRPKIPQK